MRGLIDRDTFRIIPENKIADAAIVLLARLNLTIKSVDDVTKVKAPFVIEGHQNSTKIVLLSISKYLAVFDSCGLNFNGYPHVYPVDGKRTASIFTP